VAFVSSYGGLGGSEVYLERLLDRLDGSYVGPIIALQDGPLVDRLRVRGLKVDVLTTSGMSLSLAVSAWKLRRRLLKTRPDLVHANGLKAVIVTLLAVLGSGLPVVWVRHDFSMEGWRARAIARRCRTVICVSHALTRTFGKGELRRVQVIRTGVPEVNLARDQARKHIADVAKPQANPIISLVGHLIPGKGHLELIEIVPQLLARLPRAQILIVGGTPSNRFTPYADLVHERVAQLGLSKIVRFLGHRDDVMMMIAGSDLVVMPSMSSHKGIETEGFPLLALEALAAGTPVVAYAVGGIPELIADCGLLVSPGNRYELREAILRLARDRFLWDRLSRCGKERVRRSFTIAEMIHGLEGVYSLAAER
jgi:glycosyltransferase involved in cell wall biosynthesis